MSRRGVVKLLARTTMFTFCVTIMGLNMRPYQRGWSTIKHTLKINQSILTSGVDILRVTTSLEL